MQFKWAGEKQGGMKKQTLNIEETKIAPEGGQRTWFWVKVKG